jgi:2-dehydro-3-deoxyphosphogluconate aldolase/(4S)-4-hydroxy-2-oxoglutarate aldolase
VHSTKCDDNHIPETNGDSRLIGALRRHRLLVIVRGEEPDSIVRCIDTLVATGIRLIEISVSSRAGLEALELAATRHGTTIDLGAGTVLTVGDAQRASDAGATFLVTPCLGSGSHAGRRLGLPVLPGALTPTEVWRVLEAGFESVKLFPASLGGVGHLRALLQPFPHLLAVPVGGVQLSEVRDYLDAGALAVGVGAPLVQDAAHGGDMQLLRVRTQRLLSSVIA